ncbi:hypothetical protein HanRHA438_Chr12g0541931 [Helianthus annuus]|nr:hypothetical protein HanPI659440_Chr12g0451611 [Helianthus annuus]KAJ0865570.1 hypothetical protein HanRHA438_Chr12g0541931 [Helianthus annuus]
MLVRALASVSLHTPLPPTTGSGEETRTMPSPRSPFGVLTGLSSTSHVLIIVF